MGDHVTLAARDGHQLGAYLARPDGPARSGLVVCQEIFGVNAHIREVADGFAGEGYLTIAPALFDRLERDVELGYGEKILLVPGHCDPTVNLYDWYVGIRGGQVERVWPVAARGAVA